MNMTDPNLTTNDTNIEPNRWVDAPNAKVEVVSMLVSKSVKRPVDVSSVVVKVVKVGAGPKGGYTPKRRVKSYVSVKERALKTAERAAANRKKESEAVLLVEKKTREERLSAKRATEAFRAAKKLMKMG